MRLEELQVLDIAERIWKIVIEWDYFKKDTIGKQLVRFADSIAANLSEGFGRYHYNEAKHFAYYSRGSLYESKTWLAKAYNRKLITETVFNTFMNDIDIIGVKLNNYINSIGTKKSENTNDNE